MPKIEKKIFKCDILINFQTMWQFVKWVVVVVSSWLIYFSK